MAEYIVVVNQDNTINIPTEVQKKLILEPGDKMLIRFDNTGEHLVMGKLPMDIMEKASEIENSLGHEVKIKK